MVFVFLLIGVVVIVAVFSSVRAQNKGYAVLKSRLSMQYALDEVFVSPDDLSFLGFDFVNKKVIVGNRTADFAYSFESIASVEVVRNGVMLSQTNRGSQALGAVVGGLAFGGVGALLGGLTGSTRMKERISELKLKIIADDTIKPVHTVTIFASKSKKGADPRNILLRPFLEQLDRSHAHLVNAIRNTQNQRLSNSKVSQPTGDVAGELTKLWELKQLGALTSAEYHAAKAEMLSGGRQELPASPAPLPEKSGRPVSVIIVGCKNKIAGIKALRDVSPQLSITAAKRVVENLPNAFFQNISVDAAHRIRAELVYAGFVVEILDPTL